MDGERKVVTCSDGSTYTCDNVVVATGTFGRTPSGRRSRASRPGRSASRTEPTQAAVRAEARGVLVVGASHSGGDIAFAGRNGSGTRGAQRTDHGQVPFRLEKPAAKVVFLVAGLLGVPTC